MAWAVRATGALALDQPLVRAGLLGMADSARVGRALGGHRRGYRTASGRIVRHLRARAGVAAGPSAGARRAAECTAGRRSEERRVGKECRSWGLSYPGDTLQMT